MVTIQELVELLDGYGLVITDYDLLAQRISDLGYEDVALVE